MRNLVVLFIHFIATLARLLGAGGVRSLVAESLLLKHQLLLLNRPPANDPPISVGPYSCRLDGTLGATNSSAPFRNRIEALDAASFSQSRKAEFGHAVTASPATPVSDCLCIICAVASCGLAFELGSRGDL
jgi:hypothetical protein